MERIKIVYIDNDYWWVKKEYKLIKEETIRKLTWWDKIFYLGLGIKGRYL